jgi:uncharacterized protein (UPF0261 family)
MPHIILIGTLDSKLDEFLYLRSQLLECSTYASTPLKITTIDCGRTSTQHGDISITQAQLVQKYGSKENIDISTLDRGGVIRYMISCATDCVKDLVSKGEVHGILSAGGSGGTSLVSAVMRAAAPVGMPKLIVSTVASGDTGPIVGETDITLMYSVVDIAGMNAMLRDVLSNAAGAMMGMSTIYESNLTRRATEGNRESAKLQLGITMFGVTTPCVNQIRKHLTKKYPVELYVFHATGHGGKAMERLVEEGRLNAVLDVTTTEICDQLMGGNMSAGPDRLEAALKRGIPNVISLGATDMVNFGAMSAVPPHFKERKLLEHNPTVTLMRTTKEEGRMIGEFIVEKIKTFAKDPEKVEVWLPRGGVSIIAKPGQIFEDEEADTLLAETIKEGLRGTRVRVVEDMRDINDAGFAAEIAESLMNIVRRRREPRN